MSNAINCRPFRQPDEPLRPDQAELRKLVLKQVEADPASFWMSTWESQLHRQDGSCGTTRCIAGWAEFFSDGSVPPNPGLVPSGKLMDYNAQRESRGIELLGLTRDEYFEGGAALFSDGNNSALKRLRELCEDPEGGSGDAA